MDISKIVGENLRQLRTERNLSLGQLGELSGVSKVMLSQIERGESSPTINTLWKIAGGLKVTYSQLLERQERDTAVVRGAEIVPQPEEGGHYRLYCCWPTTPQRNFELFRIELDVGHSHTTDGHNERTEEYILVIAGQLSLTVGGETHVLNPGDSVRFAASGEHIYASTGAETLVAADINYYPAL